MSEVAKSQRKRQAILDQLAAVGEPVRTAALLKALQADGLDLSPRTLRHYLKQLQDDGLIAQLGRRGCTLTDRGLTELNAPRVVQRVGYMNSRIDEITFAMNFDLELRAGTVAVNTALVTREALKSRLKMIRKVFAQRYAMGSLVGLLNPGETVGAMTIPDDMLGLCTVCSVTLNGILLKHGVPTRSIFSGLLDIDKGQPVGFAELINYDGTSLDPLELFIRSAMTDYVGAITHGTGRIGAGFREVPAAAYDLVVGLADRAERIGLGGFLRIGRPGETLFNIPVRPGCCGAVVIGGLNPVAVLVETGEQVQAFAMSGLMEFHRLFPYTELADRMRGA